MNAPLKAPAAGSAAANTGANTAAPNNVAANTAMRLKIAIQKSGRLTDSSLDLLSRCGLKFSRGKTSSCATARTCHSMCCSCATTTFRTWSKKMSAILASWA